MSDKLVLYEVKEEIAYITLNRPEKGNALSPELCAGLGRAWSRFEDDPAARVAILGGAGMNFCVGLDLELLLSVQHERVVRNDSTVAFDQTALQLPKTPTRPHYVRCPVLVHELLDGRLGVSYQGRLIARFTREGHIVGPVAAPRRAA